jgi:hypothetical protein
VVEGARLESVYTGNRIEGSNPFLSAIRNEVQPDVVRFFYAPKRVQTLACLSERRGIRKTGHYGALVVLHYFIAPPPLGISEANPKANPGLLTRVSVGHNKMGNALPYFFPINSIGSPPLGSAKLIPKRIRVF